MLMDSLINCHNMALPATPSFSSSTNRQPNSNCNYLPRPIPSKSIPIPLPSQPTTSFVSPSSPVGGLSTTLVSVPFTSSLAPIQPSTSLISRPTILSMATFSSTARDHRSTNLRSPASVLQAMPPTKPTPCHLPTGFWLSRPSSFSTMPSSSKALRPTVLSCSTVTADPIFKPPSRRRSSAFGRP